MLYGRPGELRSLHLARYGHVREEKKEYTWSLLRTPVVEMKAGSMQHSTARPSGEGLTPPCSHDLPLGRRAQQLGGAPESPTEACSGVGPHPRNAGVGARAAVTLAASEKLEV